MRLALPRPSLLVLVVLCLVAAMVPLGRAEAVDPTAPVGNPTVAYTPGALVAGAATPSTPVAYEGEPLAVRTTPIGGTAGEPTLGVQRDGTAFYAALRGLATDVLKSEDGGLTWTDSSPKVGSIKVPPATLDPYVWVDEETDRVFNIELSVACSTISHSDNDGASWISNPLGCGQPVNDHQTVITANPPAPLQTVGYPNIVYYCFNRVADASCSRSLNGGVTFEPSGSPSFPGYEVGEDYNKFGVAGLCGGLHGHAVADTEGRLFIPKVHCGIPSLAVSEDGGMTWTRTLVNTELIGGSAHVGEHSSVAVDDAGNVYYLWYEDATQKPWLAVSTDHGRTFGAPMNVAPPGVEQSNLMTLVAGAEGRIAMTFPGSRSADFEDELRPWDTWIITSTNANSATPTFLATTANPAGDPIHRGTCTGRCGAMLDFLDIIVSPADGMIWATAVDNCTAVRACNTAEPQQDPSTGNEGLVIRQLGGPPLRDVAPTG
jgi:hypothetical protein